MTQVIFLACMKYQQNDLSVDLKQTIYICHINLPVHVIRSSASQICPCVWCKTSWWNSSDARWFHFYLSYFRICSVPPFRRANIALRAILQRKRLPYPSPKWSLLWTVHYLHAYCHASIHPQWVGRDNDLPLGAVSGVLGIIQLYRFLHASSPTTIDLLYYIISIFNDYMYYK